MSMPESLIDIWLRRLQGFRALIFPPPAVPPPPSVSPAPARLSWQAELLAESHMAWEAERLEPVSADEASDPTPTPLGVAAPAAWVPPQVQQSAALFARYGYPPGGKPPSLLALKALYEAVYQPCLAPLPGRILADTALFGAIDTWQPQQGNDNLLPVHLIFRQLSALLSDAFAFSPAPLGRVDRHRTLGGYYDHQEQAIFLSTSLFQAHAAAVVNTIVHEQMHRLQHLLIQRLLYAPRKLAPAERSLATYWHDEGTAQPGEDFAAYRYNGREYHADQMAKALIRGLMPIFGWSPAVLAY